jgi:hypothetical protein
MWKEAEILVGSSHFSNTHKTVQLHNLTIKHPLWSPSPLSCLLVGNSLNLSNNYWPVNSHTHSSACVFIQMRSCVSPSARGSLLHFLFLSHTCVKRIFATSRKSRLSRITQYLVTPVRPSRAAHSQINKYPFSRSAEVWLYQFEQWGSAAYITTRLFYASQGYFFKIIVLPAIKRT